MREDSVVVGSLGKGSFTLLTGCIEMARNEHDGAR